jgi:hypothetical protein
MNALAPGDTGFVKVERRAATPIAGAIAGILFARFAGGRLTARVDAQCPQSR